MVPGGENPLWFRQVIDASKSLKYFKGKPTRLFGALNRSIGTWSWFVLGIRELGC
jgi:hypothetical protein